MNKPRRINVNKQTNAGRSHQPAVRYIYTRCTTKSINYDNLQGAAANLHCAGVQRFQTLSPISNSNPVCSQSDYCSTTDTSINVT